MQGPCSHRVRKRVKPGTDGTAVTPKGKMWQYPPRLHIHDAHAGPRGQIARGELRAAILSCGIVINLGLRQRVTIKRTRLRTAARTTSCHRP